MMEEYRTDDADIILLTMGSLAGTIKEVVDRWRGRGEKVGLVKLRLYRPFPAEELAEVLMGAKAVGVVEKDISMGWVGALYTDVVAAFANVKRRPLFLDFVMGLGGRDVKFSDLDEVIEITSGAASSGEVGKVLHWIGLDVEKVR